DGGPPDHRADRERNRARVLLRCGRVRDAKAGWGMSTVAAIVTALKADATIRSLTSNGVRIVDHDIRRSGWEKDTTFFDADGVIRTSLMVDDAGSTRSEERRVGKGGNSRGTQKT